MAHKYTNSDFFKTTECPSDALLLSYVKGTINNADKRLVELHLVDCEMCNDMVEGYQKMDASEISSHVKSIEIKIDEAVAKQSNSKAATSTFKWYYAAAAILLIGLTGILYQFYFNSLEETKVADLPTPHQAESRPQIDTSVKEQMNEEPPLKEEVSSKSIPDEQPVPVKSVTKKPAMMEDLAVSESDMERETPMTTEAKSEGKLASEPVLVEADKNTAATVTSGSTVSLNITAPTQSYSWTPSTEGNVQGTTTNTTVNDLFYDGTSLNAVEINKNLNDKKKLESATTSKFKAKAAEKSPVAKQEANNEQEETAALKDVSADDADLLSETKQLLNSKKYNEAIINYNLYLKTHPKNCEAIAGLAQCYEFTNQINQAINDYTQLSKLKCGKQSDSAYLKLAELYLKNKQTNEAKAVLQKATNSKYLDIAEQAKSELNKL